MQGFHQGLRNRNSLFAQTLLHDHPKKGLFVRQTFLRNHLLGCCEHQVAPKRDSRVKLVWVETINVFIQTFLNQSGVNLCAQSDNAFGKFGMISRLNPCAQHTLKKQFGGAKSLSNLEPKTKDILFVFQIGDTGVKPINVKLVEAIARAARLNRAAIFARRVPIDCLGVGA